MFLTGFVRWIVENKWLYGENKWIFGWKASKRIKKSCLTSHFSFPQFIKNNSLPQGHMWGRGVYFVKKIHPWIHFLARVHWSFYLLRKLNFSVWIAQGIGIKGKEMELVWHEKASRTALQTSTLNLHTLFWYRQTTWLQWRKLQNNVVNYN